MEPWETDKTFLTRWAEGRLSSDELKVFEESEAGKQFIDLYIASKGLRLPEFDSEQELNKLRLSLQNESKSPKQIWMTPAFRVSVAAILIMVVSIVLVVFSDTKVATEFAESRNVMLPDGSEIILHAKSMVSYNELTWSDSRSIKLEGEAFFKVKDGSQFVAESESGSVRVIGTEFNVKARNSSVLVVECYSGKVEVAQATTEIVLDAGAGVRISNGQLARYNLNMGQPTWLTGQSSFEKVPLNEVVIELEILFNLKVDGSSRIPIQQFTGVIPHDNASEAIELVLGPFGLDYEYVESENRLIIK